MCVTDGVFMPAVGGAGCCASPAFLPVRPITQADLATVTERVRHRVIRWFRLAHLLDASAAADMIAWENSGFSIDSSVRIALIDRDVPSYFQSVEHLLRYCARPPFALERLSVIRGPAGRITQVRYVLPRHKAANCVGRGRGRKSTRPGANGVVELTPFEFLNRLADLVQPPRKHRHRYHGVFAPNHKLRPAVTAHDKREHRQAARGCHRWACGRPSRHGGLLLRESESKAPLPRHVTDCLGQADGEGRGGVSACVPHLRRRHPADRIQAVFASAKPSLAFALLATSGCGGHPVRDPGPIRKILTHLGEPLEPPPVSPARGPPTDWGELVQIHDDRDVFQATDRRAARDRYSQPLSGAGCDPRMSGNCEL
jgi:hypothetical protein